MPHLVLSSPERFLGALDASGGAADLPLVADELQRHAVGCYAAHSGIKRWNRRAEQALLEAEAWAVVASRLCGVEVST